MFRKIIFLILISLFFQANSFAFWVWTPETNKWVNPKYSVKETPRKQLEYALTFYKEKDYKKAINEFEKLIKYYPKAKEAPEAQFHIGLALEEQDKLFEAYKAYQSIIEKYPFSERSAEIVEKQFNIGNKLLEGGTKGMMGGILGSSYDVVEVFRTVIKNAPYGPWAAHAQYKIGLYLQEKELYQEARDEFEKVMNDYPASEWAKAAKYQIALADAKRSSAAQYDQKVTKAAVDEFKEFVKVYPDAKLSEKAQTQIDSLREKEAENEYVVAAFYEKHKNYKAAQIYYNGIVENYHGSPWTQKAMERLSAISNKIK